MKAYKKWGKLNKACSSVNSSVPVSISWLMLCYSYINVPMGTSGQKIHRTIVYYFVTSCESIIISKQKVKKKRIQNVQERVSTMRPLFPEHRVESVFYRALRKLGQRNQVRGQLSLFTLFSHPSPRSAGLHVHQWPSWPQSPVSQTWFCLTGVSGKAVSWFIIYIFLLASACSIKFLPQYVSVFDKCHASSKEPNGK